MTAGARRVTPGAGRLKAALTVAAIAALIAVAGVTGVRAQQSLRYPMTGMVMQIDPSRRSVVVSHDSIPGVMAAMTMRFDVPDPADLAGVTPGAAVKFTLVLGQDTARAERLVVVPYQGLEQDPLTARRLDLLRRLTSPSRRKEVAAGEAVPEFALIDQSRRRVTLSQFRGKVVAVNFIYTSCALPQFCYRIANHFGIVEKRFRDRAGRDLVLLTVTFDPGRDTPEKLKAYARQWDADPARWRFLTGPAPDVERVCDLFGVDFFPYEGLMNHSIHTAVIDRRGNLVANIEGNEFSAAQLGDLVATALAAP